MKKVGKDTIRRTVLLKRDRLPEETRLAAGRAIAKNALVMEQVEAATNVMAYWSVRSEVPTAALISGLQKQGKRLFLPRVTGEGAMAAVQVDDLGDLSEGFAGIPEPTGPEVEMPKLDVIFVPGVAFDATGTRVGLGGGFYDRFLAKTTGLRVGLGYACQMVAEIPADEHDERVDAIVNEERVVWVRRDSP